VYDVHSHLASRPPIDSGIDEIAGDYGASRVWKQPCEMWVEASDASEIRAATSSPLPTMSYQTIEQDDVRTSSSRAYRSNTDHSASGCGQAAGTRVQMCARGSRDTTSGLILTCCNSFLGTRSDHRGWRCFKRDTIWSESANCAALTCRADLYTGYRREAPIATSFWQIEHYQHVSVLSYLLHGARILCAFAVLRC